MNEQIKQQLLEKNQKLIDMVIERAKRDFPDDIAIIGLTGSFSTNDFHEKSDLDLIIINNNDRGWGISSCFILDDVGYDIYCTPWETRIEDEANLTSPMVSCLVDLQILYCAKPEYLDRLKTYQTRALDELAKPIGEDCLLRANKWIEKAKQSYTDIVLSDLISLAKLAASNVLYYSVNAIVNMNNTYIKRGVKRYIEELSTYQYLPENFEKNYMTVVHSKTFEEIKFATYEMLKSVSKLYDKMAQEFIKLPTPTYDTLNGSYEELWCNYRNKVLASVKANDAAYVYWVARGAQQYLDEITESIGTKKFDVMQYFDSDNLYSFQEAFLLTLDEYLEEYQKVGIKVNRYETFEQLYQHFMKT